MEKSLNILKPVKFDSTKKKEDKKEAKEFLKKVFWVKLLGSLIIGIIFGVISMTGIIPIFVYVIIEGIIVYVYVYSILKTPDDAYGGLWTILGDGLMPTISAFLLCWVSSYTLVNFSL